MPGRRVRPAPAAAVAPAGAAVQAALPIPLPEAPAAVPGEHALEDEEVAHLAEVGESPAIDAALEPVQRSWDLPAIDLLADAPASSAAQLDLTAKGQRIRETLAHFGIGVKVARIQ